MHGPIQRLLPRQGKKFYQYEPYNHNGLNELGS